jgi:hypothetical protein
MPTLLQIVCLLCSCATQQILLIWVASMVEFILPIKTYLVVAAFIS